jgi:hypothetical protein
MIWATCGGIPIQLSTILKTKTFELNKTEEVSEPIDMTDAENPIYQLEIILNTGTTVLRHKYTQSIKHKFKEFEEAKVDAEEPTEKFGVVVEELYITAPPSIEEYGDKDEPCRGIVCDIKLEGGIDRILLPHCAKGR